MKTWQIIGLVAATGLGVSAGIWWFLKRHLAKRNADADSGDAAAEGEAETQAKPKTKPSRRVVDDEVSPRPATGHLLGVDELDPELRAKLDERFPDGWPPTDEVIDNLEPKDVLVVAVQSDPNGPFERTQVELMEVTVLEVGEETVETRIRPAVMLAEHFGTFAGHGHRAGERLTVPRDKILVAARESGEQATGYGSKGHPEGRLKPDLTAVYKVNPETPYDLIMPYRTDEMVWTTNRENVKFMRVGEHGLNEQIMFCEDAARGSVTLRAIDNDPEMGKVLIGRWNFEISA
ncbi:hypothetical protein PPSIR1_39180 [Plesiocystis pacifica SIR-1]|uniref:Uncharacterized protein n=2 Tax=Plesiocystis pacifica TaxID=191768 RepID=A6GJ09_9BACT|nr:hypothetical protein PPSIR1_39180 [Plesiocystis pacifica SIR-1]